MTATEAPVLAPNPVKSRSGGPKTRAGKDSARRNALKHGMRSRVVFPDDLTALIAERTGRLHDQFQPKTMYETWLVDQVAVNTTLLDRCAELTIADIGRRVDRADLCWDDDRRLDVENLGSRLSKNPGKTIAALRRTTQGADWLIERWTALGDALRMAGDWDEAQRTLALDLLGTPPELRKASRLVHAEAGLLDLSNLVADQIAGLRARQREALDVLDAEDREFTRLGAPSTEDGQTLRLRRYEAECRRSLRWALAEFDRVRYGFTPAAAPDAPAIAPHDPEPSPEPDGNPSSFALTSMLARLASSLARTDEAEPDEPETKVPATPASDAASPTLSRRARRAREKQARLNAKRAAKAAAASR